MSKSQGLKDLLSWGKEHGLVISDSIDFFFSKDKGVSATLTRDISDAEREDLIKVPKSCILGPTYAQRVFEFLNDNEENVNAKSQLLLAKLKFDKEDTIVDNITLNTEFKPYIDFLPSNGEETHSVYFWSMAEKELLDGTDAHIFMKRQFLQSLKEWRQLATQLYEKFPEKYPQLKDELLEYEAFKMGPVGGVAVNYLLNIKPISWTSFTAYLWAGAIFTSRAFPYILFDKGAQVNSAFLLPVVDLLNHENGRNVKWSVKDNTFIFHTRDTPDHLKKGMELYNNYGDKSNLELLLGYGFVIDHNENESATLTLQVGESVIDGAKSYGIPLPKEASAKGINFDLTKNDPLPESILGFFSYLSKLSSERKGTTLRMRLEGLSQLRSILQTKLNSLKSLEVTANDDVLKDRAVVIKKYRNTQKNIFQHSIEEADKLEKKLLKTHKPFSFKTALKQDTKFFNALFLTFGLRSYDDIVENGMLNHYILLWIMRVSNKDQLSKAEQDLFPQFIYDTFQDVKGTVTVDDEDVTEYLPLYETLFPSLCQKIPEVFGEGEWTLNSMVFAGTVSDRLVYQRQVNKEAFFVKRKCI